MRRQWPLDYLILRPLHYTKIIVSWCQHNSLALVPLSVELLMDSNTTERKEWKSDPAANVLLLSVWPTGVLEPRLQHVHQIIKKGNSHCSCTRSTSPGEPVEQRCTRPRCVHGGRHVCTRSRPSERHRWWCFPDVLPEKVGNAPRWMLKGPRLSCSAQKETQQHLYIWQIWLDFWLAICCPSEVKSKWRLSKKKKKRKICHTACSQYHLFFHERKMSDSGFKIV